MDREKKRLVVAEETRDRYVDCADGEEAELEGEADAKGQKVNIFDHSVGLLLLLLLLVCGWTRAWCHSFTRWACSSRRCCSATLSFSWIAETFT